MLKKTFILSALSLFTLVPSFSFANPQQDNSIEINSTINNVKPDAKSDTTTKTDAVNSELSQQPMCQTAMIQNKRMIDEPLDLLFSFKSSQNDGFYSADEFLKNENLVEQHALYQPMVVNNKTGEFMADAHAYLTSPRMLGSALLFSRLYEATGFLLKNRLTNFEKTLVLFYNVKDLNGAINDLKTIYQVVKNSQHNVFVVPYSTDNQKAGLELLALFSALPVDSLLSNNQTLVAPSMNKKIANALFSGLVNNYRVLNRITPAINDVTFIKKENDVTFIKKENQILRRSERHNKNEYDLIYDKTPIKEDMVKYLIDEISLNSLVEKLTNSKLNKK